MKRVKKAYQVFDKKDTDELGMPWVETDRVKVLETQNANHAKSIANIDCDYIDLRARRTPEDDIYLFEGSEISKESMDYRIAHRAWLAKMNKLVNDNKGRKVKIYSGQWGAYWGTNRRGYTGVAGAGIYDIADAWSATSHCGLEKKIRFELLEVEPVVV